MEVVVEEIVAAAADKVWAVMSNFGGIERSAMIQDVVVEGSGVGMLRTLTMTGGGIVQERLETFDPASRTYSYAIVNPDSPLPVSGYLSTVTISANEEASARVRWSSRFEPVGVPAEKAEALIAGIYKGGIQRARTKLGLA